MAELYGGVNGSARHDEECNCAACVEWFAVATSAPITGRCVWCGQPIDRHEIVIPLAGCPATKTL